LQMKQKPNKTCMCLKCNSTFNCQGKLSFYTGNKVLLNLRYALYCQMCSEKNTLKLQKA